MATVEDYSGNPPHTPTAQIQVSANGGRTVERFCALLAGTIQAHKSGHLIKKRNFPQQERRFLRHGWLILQFDDH